MTRMRSTTMASAKVAGIMAAPTVAIEATADSLADATARQEGVSRDVAAEMCAAELCGASLQTVRAILTITNLLAGTSLILSPVDKVSAEGVSADGHAKRIQPQGQGWSSPPVGMGRSGGGRGLSPHRKGQKRVWER